MNKRITALAIVISVALGGYGIAWAALQFIYLGGPIGDQGTFPVLGWSNPVFPSNAPHTATQAEYAGEALYVTSSTSLLATQPLILPLTEGNTKDICNATTGGQAITVGGATGATVTIANGLTNCQRVYCPDGVGYYSLGSAGGGGGGFDAAAFSGAPGFLYYDGGSTVWRGLSASDIPCLLPDGGGTGICDGGGKVGQPLISTGAGTWTYGDPLAGGATVDDIIGAGTGILKLYPNEVITEVDGGGQVRSATVESVADASTWTTVLQLTPKANSGHEVKVEFNGYDLADQPEAGPADNFSCVLRYKLTTSNTGAVWYLPYPANTNPVTLTVATPACNVNFGAQDAAVITSPPVSFQLVNDGGATYLQWKGVPGQSPWTSTNEVDIVRRY